LVVGARGPPYDDDDDSDVDMCEGDDGGDDDGDGAEKGGRGGGGANNNERPNNSEANVDAEIFNMTASNMMSKHVLNSAMLMVVVVVLTISAAITTANPVADRFEELEAKSQPVSISSNVNPASPKLVAIYGRPYSESKKRAERAIDTLTGITMGKRAIKPYDDIRRDVLFRGYLLNDADIMNNNSDDVLFFSPLTLQQAMYGRI
ncbi:hypothetical protein GZH46_02919, partial [Fragariocoptes setiger]